MDVKKTWRIPPGGGRRYELTEQGGESIPRSGKRGYGYDCLHVAIDDHSRYLYTELLPDQRGVTTVGFFQRAVEHFAGLGVRVEQLLTDNALNYRYSGLKTFAQAQGIRLKRTRPYRPQTNGKAERVIQTLLREWAYLRLYETNNERNSELLSYLAYYNTQRPHSALGGLPPITRIRKQRP
jgi:transposase InsO family protein